VTITGRASAGREERRHFGATAGASLLKSGTLDLPATLRPRARSGIVDVTSRARAE